ncbi:MAG TPA: hypothetical protein VF747_14735 [Blastocatellia bacterium]|jgi:hypothetical protein
MAVKLIKHGHEDDKKRDQPAGPEQFRMTAQSWVNEFKARKRNVAAVIPAQPERLQVPR